MIAPPFNCLVVPYMSPYPFCASLGSLVHFCPFLKVIVACPDPWIFAQNSTDIPQHMTTIGTGIAILNWYVIK